MTLFASGYSMHQTALHVLFGSILVVGLPSHERCRSLLYSNVIGFVRELNARSCSDTGAPI